MTKLIFFDKEKELTKLTGLNHEELWDNGFCLDDWDWGFQSDECFGTIENDEYGFQYHNHNYSDLPAAINMILQYMDTYCVGYKVNKYKDKYYFMLYHA